MITEALGIEIGEDRVRAAVASVDATALVLDEPALVGLTDSDEVVVGRDAEALAATHPGRVAGQARAALGRPEPLMVATTPYGAEAILAQLLRHAVDASARGDGADAGVAIVATHPVDFGPHQLDLMQEVARLAAVGDVRFLDEGTARAHAPDAEAPDAVAAGAARWALDNDGSGPASPPPAGTARSARTALLGLGGVGLAAGIAGRVGGGGATTSGRTMADFADGSGRSMGDFADGSGRSMGDFAEGSGRSIADFATSTGGKAAATGGKLKLGLAAGVLVGGAAIGAVVVTSGDDEPQAAAPTTVEEVVATTAVPTTAPPTTEPVAVEVRDIPFLFAGGGEGPMGAGDGGPALAASFMSPVDVAVGPDGAVYVLDAGDIDDPGQVRVVDTDGGISTLDSEAGGQGLLHPTSLTVGPDSSVYVADAGNHRVVRISAGGDPTVVAGTGERADEPPADGTPGRDVGLGNPTSVATGPDGAIYIADERTDVVLRLEPDGTLHIAAGGGDETPADGLSGPEVNFNAQGDGGPRAIAVASDGTVYIGTWKTIWSLDPAGTLTPVAGDPSRSGADDPNGDGGPALDAGVSVTALAVTDGGDLLVAERDTSLIRRIADGTITRWAGGDTSSPGSPPDENRFNPNGLATAPDGSVYVAEPLNTYRIVRRLPASGVPAS